VSSIISKAAKGKSLALDLRRSSGEGENGMLRLVGALFDKDIHVTDIAGRDGTKSLVAKTRGDRAFKGNLFVLVDSETRALAEVFARLIQIEKRGVIIGDHTAGRAMKTKIVEQAQGSAWLFPFLLRIAEAQMIMPDGKSIGRSGVAPDEVLLPTAADMASGRDSVLSRVAAKAGEGITSEEAGALFNIRQKK
jgi:C-terminal processing protease CtpA/Prc